MDFLKPIYTEAAQCQDCYKCLRRCQLKAIQIQDGHAKVMHEYCVMCGSCVLTCPVGAKKVRNDLEKAKLLIKSGKKVILSLAPSFVSEFDKDSKADLIRSIKRLGFYGVSETALGAQEISANVASLLKDCKDGIFISSACPTAVAIIKKYYPQYAGNVTDMLSPVLAHSKILKSFYGENIAVVFAGPCIAKKIESDIYGDILDLAITFKELRSWIEHENMTVSRELIDSENDFIPHTAVEGAMYPVDGGMIAGIRANCGVNDAEFMAFSGVDNIRRVLEDLGKIKMAKPIFLELLACEGGCVNGPAAAEQGGTASKRVDILNYTEYPSTEIPRAPKVNVNCEWNYEPVKRVEHKEIDILAALKQVGKYCKDDELNCSGCGYDSCRQFAEAFLDGKAEVNMCVSYMRQLAHKKANALIRTMPSGLVLVDNEMKVVECNRKFAELLGDETIKTYDDYPGLEGACIDKLIPFGRLFRQALEKGTEIIEKDIKLGNLFLHVTIFTIETNRLVGCFLQDVTAPAVQKEQIINKAKKVIEQNISTVQQIAYLLGENASESEVILNSIVNSFSVESVETGKDDKK